MSFSEIALPWLLEVIGLSFMGVLFVHISFARPGGERRSESVVAPAQGGVHQSGRQSSCSLARKSHIAITSDTTISWTMPAASDVPTYRRKSPK